MTDLTPTDMHEQVEAMKARDQRVALIGRAIRVDDELRDSPAWEYIRHRAMMDWYEALIALATAPPQDQNRIRQLQAKAAVRDNIETWFKELADTAAFYDQQIEDERRAAVED